MILMIQSPSRAVLMDSRTPDHERLERTVRYLKLGLEDQAELMRVNAQRMKTLCEQLGSNDRAMLGSHARQLESAALISNNWAKNVGEIMPF